MISEREFKEKARFLGLPISTIERDYAQAWLLSSLPEMAFKGGTSLRKIYFGDYRFSDDLDFTLLESTDLNKLEKQIRNAIRETKEETGITFLDELQSEEVVNGYVFTVYFRILRMTGAPLKIKIDITEKNNEIIVKQLQQKEILHPYSDDINKKVLVYSIEEIFAEKIRSLFERTRPRDLYDIWHLSKQLELDNSILHKKFKYKKVEFDFEDLLNRKGRFINAWENSLKHQLKTLPNGDDVYQSVIATLKGAIK